MMKLFAEITAGLVHDWNKHGPLGHAKTLDEYIAQNIDRMSRVELLQAISYAIDEINKSNAAEEDPNG